MIKRLVSLFFVVCFLLPFVFGTGLFGFLENERQIYWPTDLNREDVNFHILWADEAWITTLHAVDINATNVTDFNVTGDVNSTGNVAADICFVSDCFSSASDLDNWIDASGPNWVFNNFSLIRKIYSKDVVENGAIFCLSFSIISLAILTILALWKNKRS